MAELSYRLYGEKWGKNSWKSTHQHLNKQERPGAIPQVEAAKLIGISTDTLENYERGKSYPDIPVLRKIEEVYGVPYDRLIFLPLDYNKSVNIY